MTSLYSCLQCIFLPTPRLEPTNFELPSLPIICQRSRPHDYLGHIKKYVISLYSSINRRHSHPTSASSHLPIFAYSEIRNCSEGNCHDLILSTLDYGTKLPICTSMFIIFLFPFKDVTISYHYRSQWRMNNGLMPSWDLVWYLIIPDLSSSSSFLYLRTCFVWFSTPCFTTSANVAHLSWQ